jgi:hypothetical protein
MTAKRVYFFHGTDYTRFDSAINAVLPLVYPRAITSGWPGLFPGGIDGALYRGKGRAHFFSGNQYSRYTVLPDRVDVGYPKPISGNWPGFDGTGFENGIDDALNWGNGKVYFFKGAQYLRYDLTADKVDAGYPKPISGNWGGINGTGFENGIDAALNYGNNKVYFFKDDKYVRIDMNTKSVDAGYPKLIAGNWPGVPTTGLSAVLEWPYADLAAGGFNVPTARGGCIAVPTTAGRRKAGERFNMQLDFVDTPYPATCAVGEYRQYVRGSFVVNGTGIVHGLPNPAGGAPLTMLPTPAVGAAANNFLEDGLVTPPATANVWYGHRIDTAGNTDTTDVYPGDRMESCQYRGNDFPGIESAIGNTFSVVLDFQGDAVDSATSGQVLQTTQWTVNCSGTL